MSKFANFAKKTLGFGGRDERKKDYRVAMLGLDGGGKTSLLYGTCVCVCVCVSPSLSLSTYIYV